MSVSPKPKVDVATDGKTKRHHSAGAVIERDGAFLLIERLQIPLGFAGLAGHVDEGEEPHEALVREVREESGLVVISSDIIASEEVWDNTCGYGVSVHYWTLYSCETTGEPVLDPHEARSMAWSSEEGIRKLAEKNALEPVWKYWFTKLGVLD